MPSRRVFDERQVERAQVGADEVAAAGVAEGAGRLQHERRRDRTTGPAGRAPRCRGRSRARSRDDPGRCPGPATGSTASATGWSSRTPSADCRSASSRCRRGSSRRGARPVAPVRSRPGSAQVKFSTQLWRTSKSDEPPVVAGDELRAAPTWCRWWRRRRRSTPGSCPRSSRTCRTTAPTGPGSSGGGLRRSARCTRTRRRCSSARWSRTRC